MGVFGGGYLIYYSLKALGLYNAMSAPSPTNLHFGKRIRYTHHKGKIARTGRSSRILISLAWLRSKDKGAAKSSVDALEATFQVSIRTQTF